MFNLKFIIEDPVVLYALIIFIIAFAYQIFHLIFLRQKFARCKTTYSADASYELPPVSVVLCLRDDYSTLKSDIPILLNQEYPDYEIVIVNFSTNATELQTHRCKNKPERQFQLFQSLSFGVGRQICPQRHHTPDRQQLPTEFHSLDQVDGFKIFGIAYECGGHLQLRKKGFIRQQVHAL